MGAKRAAENAPSISANAFDDFQSTGLTGYNVPSKNSHEARVSLNSSGLTPTAASTAVSAASGVWLRRVLLAVAAFETLVGLIDLAGNLGRKSLNFAAAWAGTIGHDRGFGSFPCIFPCCSQGI